MCWGDEVVDDCWCRHQIRWWRWIWSSLNPEKKGHKFRWWGEDEFRYEQTRWMVNVEVSHLMRCLMKVIWWIGALKRRISLVLKGCRWKGCRWCGVVEMLNSALKRGANSIGKVSFDTIIESSMWDGGDWWMLRHGVLSKFAAKSIIKVAMMIL